MCRYWEEGDLPFSSTTIFPPLWSSTYSNSPIYPAVHKGCVKVELRNVPGMSPPQKFKCILRVRNTQMQVG